jgi:hypothetical protein
MSQAQPESSPAATVTSKFYCGVAHASISLTVSLSDVVGMCLRFYPWPEVVCRVTVAINSTVVHDEVFTSSLVS